MKEIAKSIKVKKAKVIKEKKKKPEYVIDQKCGRCGLNLLKKWFAKHWRTSHRVKSKTNHKVLAEG